MMDRVLFMMLVFAILAFSGISLALVVNGQYTEEQLRDIFVSKGCATCHDGSTAPNWDGIKNLITSWAQSYATIDEASIAEYGKSFEELMSEMRSYTPQITDEEYNALYQFYVNLFQESKPPETTTTAPSGTNAAETVTVTKEVTKTVTKTKTVYRIINQTKTVIYTVTEYTTGEQGGFDPIGLAPIAASIILIAALVVFVMKIAKSS